MRITFFVLEVLVIVLVSGYGWYWYFYRKEKKLLNHLQGMIDDAGRG